MKKLIIACSFIICTTQLFAANMTRKEQALRERSRLMQRGYSRKDIAKQAAKGALFGATVVPAAIGTGVMTYESGMTPANVAAGTVAGLAMPIEHGRVSAMLAGATAALNVARNYALLQWQIRKISGVLNEYAQLEFKSLPEEYALILVAAYKRNVPVLKSLVEIHEEFLSEKGIWKVITQLFYNQKPTKNRVKELQKMIQEA